MEKTFKLHKKGLLQLVVADKKGSIYTIPHLHAAGMKGGLFFKLVKRDLIKLPHDSELFIMPKRPAVGYDPESRGFVAVDKNPLSGKREPCFAVSAFISPGYTITYNASYVESPGLNILPLFSYAAVCFYKNSFYVAAIMVDRERRQDARFMDNRKIKPGIREVRRLFPANRLFRHLERCALCYQCPAAKNLFLKRYEAPLPASPSCNSRCIGCISYQPDKKCPVTQPRIKFVPTPEEIAEVALFHIGNVKDPVVSFGQGCEGEPLLAGKVIEESVKIIRRETSKGTINLNTNASRPEMVKRLFKAGLNSMRVSINSAQEKYYNRYYKPIGYRFGDLMKSINIAKSLGGFVSLNYLVMPGFTDSEEEFIYFRKLLRVNKIDMVQLRNLNIDPIFYFKEMGMPPDPIKLRGMREVISTLKKQFPRLMLGYFNPSKSRIRRQH
jgi:wyosine [tRNA(Phe)-imidazoG37] synthetase (radical SAM superfamily)